VDHARSNAPDNYQRTVMLFPGNKQRPNPLLIFARPSSLRGQRWLQVTSLQGIINVAARADARTVSGIEYDNQENYRAPLRDSEFIENPNENANDHSDADRIGFHPDVRFARFVRPYLAEAYVLARGLSGNGTDAEDIVQEASLSAFRAIASFANGNARHWVLTIVRHCGYQWLRKNRRNSLVHVKSLESVEEANAETHDGNVKTPETELIAKADAERLTAAIDEIPEPFRATLILRVKHDLNYREIADVMNVPVGTVMSRLARARHYLMAVVGQGTE
jgi:RNA polymerase sigma factor (sigma-70 family)